MLELVDIQHITVTAFSRSFQWYSCHFLTRISSRVNKFFCLPLQSEPVSRKTRPWEPMDNITAGVEPLQIDDLGLGVGEHRHTGSKANRTERADRGGRGRGTTKH